MKKFIKNTFLVVIIAFAALGISSYFFGSDIFNAEKIVDLANRNKSTSVLIVDDENNNSSEGFYYSSLNEEEKSVYDKIYSRAKNQYTSVKIHSNIDAQRILEIASFVENEHPQLFWLNGNYSIDTSNVLTLGSSYDDDEIAKLSAEIKSSADSILQNVNDNMTDYEKSLYIYDYIIGNTKYSDEALKNNKKYPWASSLVGPLTMNKSTCLGYAKTYQYLLSLLDINSAIVLGNAKTPQGESAHAWVIQECDGACYYTDPTWGDCFEEETVSDLPSHAYFCITESELEKTHNIEHKDMLPKCTSNKDNYFVKSNLYFTSYNRSEIKTALADNANSGKYYIELKFANKNVYDNAVQKLISEGQLYHILNFAHLSNNNINLKSIKYSENKNLYILTVFYGNKDNG